MKIKNSFRVIREEPMPVAGFYRVFAAVRHGIFRREREAFAVVLVTSTCDATTGGWHWSDSGEDAPYWLTDRYRVVLALRGLPA